MKGKAIWIEQDLYKWVDKQRKVKRNGAKKVETFSEVLKRLLKYEEAKK